MPRIMKSLFDFIEGSEESMEFSVKIGIAEVYMETLRDLLDPSKTNLKLYEDAQRGVFIQNQLEEYVSDE